MENTSATTDEHIRATFDMLVERISNIEELAHRQHRAAVFAECRKFGELNKELFDCPFTIIRRRPFSTQPIPPLQPRPNPPRPVYTRYARPSMFGVFFDIQTLAVNCTCIEDTPLLYEDAVGCEMAKKVSHLDCPYPRDVGWVESRFRHVEDEAIQQHLDAVFKDSQFQCTHIQREEFGIKCHISVRELPRSSADVPAECPPLVQLDQFIQQIPKLVQATRHGSVNCISEVVITCTSGGGDDYWADVVTNIQKAANLPDGPSRDQCVHKRNLYARGIDAETLAYERTLIEVTEVYSHLRSIGKHLFLKIYE